jgi:hypothetical protein
MPRKGLIASLGIILTVLGCGGCAMMRLKSETPILEQISVISGQVSGENLKGKPIVVVVLAVDPRAASPWKAVVRRTVLYKPGSFRLFVTPGLYQIGAFEDTNEDFTFQQDEQVGWYGAPDTLTVADGKAFEALNLVLRPPAQARLELPQLYRPAPQPVAEPTRLMRAGERVSITDARFSMANAEMGLWEPLRFINQELSGIYFLEPYDAGKIPVLFVHGAGGHPGQWADIIAALDTRHFQPWLAFYPSGLRLDILRQGLAGAVTQLRAQHKPKRLYLVAHSMGGLVTRGMINVLEPGRKAELLSLFVSLSTPWGGHELAASGVANAPAVVPSWYDMVPDSPYIQALFSSPLPEGMEHVLFFSHRGGWNIMSGGNTDGAVSLKSQLMLPFQQSAKMMRGYDADHVSILSDPTVTRQLSEVLEERRARDLGPPLPAPVRGAGG